MAKHHSVPSFLNDALYCSEDNWEDEVGDFGFVEDQQLEEETSFFDTTNSNELGFLPVLLEQDLYYDDDELSSLLAKQEANQLVKILETNPSLAKARCDAIEWLLRVNSHYSFNALTAVLAVNYLDRFLFSLLFQTEKPWMTQLAAVACLSLAAKVEETHVPLLLDLQVEDCKYVFEAKTIQKMEILVLSTLHWRMNPVTPLSFLDIITRKLGLKSYICCEFLRRCQLIVLCIISDSRFMRYLPSVIAAATMLLVVDSFEFEHWVGIEHKTDLEGILEIDQGNVNDCLVMIQELMSTGLDRLLIKKKYASDPGSPNGVMDVSFSSDSSNDSWTTVTASSSVSSSPEKPLLKKSIATAAFLA